MLVGYFKPKKEGSNVKNVGKMETHSLDIFLFGFVGTKCTNVL